MQVTSVEKPQLRIKSAFQATIVNLALPYFHGVKLRVQSL